MRGNRPNNRGGYARGGFSRGRSFRGNRGNRSDYGGNWQNRNNTSNFTGQKWVNSPRRETPGKRLSEEEIGVTEYMSKHQGFNGIIKSRYSDFQVSEINEKGEIATLTDISPPEPPPEEQVDEDEDLILSKYNVEILPMDTWDKINKLVVATEAPTEKVEIDVSSTSKEDRTKIHDAVKKAFGDAIVGSTVNIDDKKLMRFEKFRKGAIIDNRVKWVWPGEYVYFIVHKENCDTMEAATRIAEKLKMHMKPQMLGYAGTKDRRAKTSQWFSVRKVDPRRLAAAACPPLALGNYSFHSQHLKLGMLQGNRFRIALRNVTADDDVIRSACEQLREKGFINYYGLQRFGTRLDVPTYDIGLQLLQGNYKQAVELIMREQEGGAGGGGGGGHRAPEARLLRALRNSPADYLTALHKVPRNTRLLYLHSYQSLVWNRCVSERIRRFGLTPSIGDLVALDEKEIKDIEIDNDESDSEENQEPESSNLTGEATKPKSKEPQEKQRVPVKVLTQEDVDSGRYTIFDIIMPLPGFNIEYPPNMKDYYEMLMTKDNLTLELKSKHKSYSMSGAYRRIGVRPRELAWSCARYDEPHADLLQSDLDALRGRTPDAPCPDGKYKAVLLTLTLPVSCYATMALRELLKVDTASDKQAAQNNYHKRRLSETEENGDKKVRLEDGAEKGTENVETS